MSSPKGYRFDKYFLNVKENRLYDETDNSPIILSDRSLKILIALIKSPEFVSTVDLVDDSTIDFSTDNPFSKSAKGSVHTSVSELRKKLKPRAIIHITGGYAFGYPVEIVNEENIENPDAIAIGQTNHTPVNFISDKKEKNSKLNWKKSTFVFLAIICILLIILGKLFFRKDDDLTKITIDKATVHLDMTNGWNDLSESDSNSSEPLSKTTVYYNYKVIKSFAVDNFSHRVGTSRIISPKWVSDNNHPITDAEDITDKEKQCSTTARISKMLYFDISNEETNKPFDLNFSVDYFNAHNQKQREYQNYFIHRPIEMLEFKISFPQGVPYPKEVRILKAQSCFREFLDQKKSSQSENPTDYVIENPDKWTFIWYIKTPTVNNIYKIQWDW